MAEGAINFFLGKLDELLTNQLNLIRGVDGEIRSLHDKLQWLQAFLRDADSKRRDNERINVWVSQIRDVAYQAEDVIDKYLYQLQRRRRDGTINCLQNCVSGTIRLKTLHDLGNQIEEIKGRLQGISDCRSQLGIEIIQTGKEASSSLPGLPEEQNRAMPSVEEANVVGFESDATILKEKLVHGDLRCSAVSIVGMGGLGKTTLARKVYNSNEVKAHFDCQAWVYVSQKYKRRELLQGILEDFLHPDRKDIVEMTEEDIVNRLRQSLERRRYLLVIDDIWNVRAWNSICNALPDEMNGSRIMLTTRNKDVGQYADPEGFIHELQCLNEEESWKLFCLKVFRTNTHNGCPLDLENIGKKMVEKCAGLPLAVVVLGGLLFRKAKTEIEWRRVLKRITYELNEREEGENVRKILALSYDDLPHYLKSCFLYFGLFPEDYEIDAKELINLWIAEGFIPKRVEQTMEEVAEDYLEELVNRCMIQVVERSTWGCIDKCRIHDLLHDLSISEGKEGKFLDTWVGDPTDAHSTASRRLAIQHNNVSYTQVSQFNQPTSILRSLFCFNVDTEGSILLIGNLMNSTKFLRVVDLRWASIKVLPRQIGEMAHLRYLGLRGTEIKSLPSSIGKLTNLQTLRLDADCWVPETVWKTKTLRHVSGSRIRTSNIHCNWKSDLQTLEVIHSGDWVERVLGELTNLRTLGIRGISPSQVPGLSDSLARLTHLNSLSLGTKSMPCTIVATLLSALANHPVLYKLSLWAADQSSGQEVTHSEGRYERQSYDNVRLPPCLTEVHLWGTCFSMLEQFECLPHLKVLQLLDDAYIGKEIVFSVGSFPQLQELRLRGLLELEKWIIEDGAMPCLQVLSIDNCERLAMIPPGLQHITTLQQLKLWCMPEEFTERVQKEEGEDWYKIQHIPSIDV